MPMRSGPSSPKVIVVGGGIAGLSVAAAVQQWASVTLIEREAHLGYHASGRSAALFAETCGNAVVRALSVASRPAIVDGGFAEHVRGALHFGGRDDDAMVDELAQKYQALVPSVRVLEISRASGCFQVLTSAGSYVADMVVNAAGAWVDVIAERAGLAGLGFSPKRRTAFMFDPPQGLDARKWPLAVDLHERFYFKPDAGKLIGSLADETDSPPCDAYPEDIDVAIAVDRIEQATELRIGRPQRPWAGLRTFSADRTPVVGFDPRLPGFFWLGGQGGYGFQVSLTLARIASALLRDAAMPQDVAEFGVQFDALTPGRFIETARTSSLSPVDR